VVERAPEEPPPFVVLVQGPPGVGKSTLIRCLVRHCTRQALAHVRGPITVVAGKSRRLTFVECPQARGRARAAFPSFRRLPAALASNAQTPWLSLEAGRPWQGGRARGARPCSAAPHRRRGLGGASAGRVPRLRVWARAQSLAAMVDAAKYADLVLLLVDGAFGFEMETFEFLNILQARPRPSFCARRGLPVVWRAGVLLHRPARPSARRRPGAYPRAGGGAPCAARRERPPHSAARVSLWAQWPRATRKHRPAGRPAGARAAAGSAGRLGFGRAPVSGRARACRCTASPRSWAC